MANTFYKRVIQEGHRNAVVQLSANLDTAVVAPTIVQQILKADFTNNDPTLVFSGFRFTRVQYSTSDGVFVELNWDATADRVMIRFTGHSEFCTGEYGGIRPVEGDAGYTGEVNVAVNAPGAAAGTQLMYHAIVHLDKVY